MYHESCWAAGVCMLTYIHTYMELLGSWGVHVTWSCWAAGTNTYIHTYDTQFACDVWKLISAEIHACDSMKLPGSWTLVWMHVLLAWWNKFICVEVANSMEIQTKSMINASRLVHVTAFHLKILESNLKRFQLAFWLRSSCVLVISGTSILKLSYFQPFF